MGETMEATVDACWEGSGAPHFSDFLKQKKIEQISHKQPQSFRRRGAWHGAHCLAKCHSPVAHSVLVVFFKIALSLAMRIAPPPFININRQCWECMHCVRDSEFFSTAGPLSGHNIEDETGNGHCINLVCVAKEGQTKQVQQSKAKGTTS